MDCLARMGFVVVLITATCLNANSKEPIGTSVLSDTLTPILHIEVTTGKHGDASFTIPRNLPFSIAGSYHQHRFDGSQYAMRSLSTYGSQTIPQIKPIRSKSRTCHCFLNCNPIRIFPFWDSFTNKEVLAYTKTPYTTQLEPFLTLFTPKANWYDFNYMLPDQKAKTVFNYITDGSEYFLTMSRNSWRKINRNK